MVKNPKNFRQSFYNDFPMIYVNANMLWEVCCQPPALVKAIKTQSVVYNMKDRCIYAKNFMT